MCLSVPFSIDFSVVWSRLTIGGFTCCVPGCYNNSTRAKGLGFYVFPKEQKLRETWIQRINRAGRGGRFSKFTPTTGHRVCGAHFEGGKKTYMNRVPTIFPLRPQKVERRRPLIRTQPELPNSPTVAPQHDPEVSGSAITSSSSDSEDTAQQSTLLMDHAYSSQESSYDQLAKKVACQNNIITELAEKAEAAYTHVEELNRQLKRSQQDHAEAKKLCDRLQQKNRCLRLELSCMQKKVKRCKAEATQKIDITYEALVEDEKKLRYYTGFTSRKSFDSFWSLLEPDAKKLRFWQMKETENEDRNFILPLKTQLVLVLMRLRLGLDGLDLAYRFGVSTSTVSRIWVTWLDFLDNRLCQVPTWMPPHLCDKYRPQAFTDKGYTTVDGILDCTEIFIETPLVIPCTDQALANLPDYIPFNTAFEVHVVNYTDDIALVVYGPGRHRASLLESLQVAVYAVDTLLGGIVLALAASKTEVLLAQPRASTRRFTP
ncbi:hypothetical protein MRX96_026817 [Rhipicephalus microplus]